MFKKILFLLISTLLFTTQGFAETKFYNPNFDCDKLTKKNKVELIICSDVELSNLNKHTNRFYQSIVHEGFASENEMEKDQKTWIKKRNLHCRQYSSCLHLYEKRLLALGDIYSNSPSKNLEKYIYGKIRGIYKTKNATFELYSKVVTTDIHQYCTLIKYANGEKDWIVEFYNKTVNYRCNAAIIADGDLYLYGSQQTRKLGDFSSSWVAKIDIEEGTYIEKKWYVLSDSNIIRIEPLENNIFLVVVHSKEDSNYTTFFTMDELLNTNMQKQFYDVYPDLETLMINKNNVKFLEKHYRNEYQFHIARF